jgi:predicted DNA-binding transcriptional regulator AlpA
MHTPRHPGSADPLLTTKEAAAYLSLQPCTLEKWRSQNKGPKSRKVGSKVVRYQLSDLDAFIAGGDHV